MLSPKHGGGMLRTGGHQGASLAPSPGPRCSPLRSTGSGLDGSQGSRECSLPPFQTSLMLAVPLAPLDLSLLCTDGEPGARGRGRRRTQESWLLLLLSPPALLRGCAGEGVGVMLRIGTGSRASLPGRPGMPMGGGFWGKGGTERPSSSMEVSSSAPSTASLLALLLSSAQWLAWHIRAAAGELAGSLDHLVQAGTSPRLADLAFSLQPAPNPAGLRCLSAKLGVGRLGPC